MTTTDPIRNRTVLSSEDWVASSSSVVSRACLPSVDMAVSSNDVDVTVPWAFSLHRLHGQKKATHRQEDTDDGLTSNPTGVPEKTYQQGKARSRIAEKKKKIKFR